MVQKESMRGTLATMQKGEIVEIPLEMRAYSYIRTCASLLGLELCRKYTVSVNRSTRVCYVTRVS